MNIRLSTWLSQFYLLILLGSLLPLISHSALVSSGLAKGSSLIKVAYTETKELDDPIYYYQRLLVLALEKTRETHGDYQLQYADKIESVDRIHQLVQSGEHANLIWASVTPERSRNLRVIPFDLLRGYNNFRLLLISEKNANTFARIKSRGDFLLLKAGNGSNWTDTRILKENGIQVETATNFDSLLKMLMAGRFDYISRGLHEIHNDVIRYTAQGYPIAIGEHILLEYKQPVYYSFFVSKKYAALAERLERGLQLAEADGSFAELFYSIPAFQRATEELAKERLKIMIDNTEVFEPVERSTR